MTMFGIAVALSAGAWFYHYETTNQAAELWGADGGRLLTKAPKVTLFELANPALGKVAPNLSGLGVSAEHDLSGKPGLVHLRFVFTQDANFRWDQRDFKQLGQPGLDFKYALRFVEGDEQLVIMLGENFDVIGAFDGKYIQVIPAPRLAGPVRQYLVDIGVVKGDVAGAKPPATADLRQAADR